MTERKPKKPSFFKRLSRNTSTRVSSMSPDHQRYHSTAIVSPNNSAIQQLEANILAGPAYKPLPAGVDALGDRPPAFESQGRTTSYHQSSPGSAYDFSQPGSGSKTLSRTEPLLSLDNAWAATSTSMDDSQKMSSQIHPISPTTRRPIHPVLASPPFTTLEERAHTEPNSIHYDIYPLRHALKTTLAHLPAQDIAPPNFPSPDDTQSKSKRTPEEDLRPLVISSAPSNALRQDSHRTQTTSPSNNTQAYLHRIHPAVSSDRAPPSAFTPSATRTMPYKQGGINGLSEASAYAKAISPILANGGLQRAQVPSTPSPANVARRVSRPLPRPPESGSKSYYTDHIRVTTYSDNTHQDVSSNMDLVLPSVKSPSSDSIPPRALSSPNGYQRKSKQSLKKSAPYTQSLPLTSHKAPCQDQTQAADRSYDNFSSPLTSQQAIGEWPAFHTSPQGRSEISPINSSSLTIKSSAKATSPTINFQRATSLLRSATTLPGKRRGRASLVVVLSNSSIQIALLSFLSINSFLSLTGASNVVRRQFSGETVARWVMGEWGIHFDRERGRTWPNLTVWEGFLESLLHDPATYSTYPPQWHNLLRHLSLSHTLLILHLRSLPASSFPSTAPLPFEDDTSGFQPWMTYSNSIGSVSSVNLLNSRVASVAGSDAGSIAPTKAPRRERVMEIIMPEPLAAQPKDGVSTDFNPDPYHKSRRRGSIRSMTSATSLSFGRKRSNSVSSGAQPRRDIPSSMSSGPSFGMTSGKSVLPPVSYPSAKRYGFRRHGDSPVMPRPQRESSRPASVFSTQSASSVALSHWMLVTSHASRHFKHPSGTSQSGTSAPPALSSFGNRASFVGSETARSHRPSDIEETSHFGRFGSPAPTRRDQPTPNSGIEAVFDRPPPFIQNRAPILRVFVPIPEQVQRWPSAEAAAAAVQELNKCGATRRLKFGDLIVNTAYRHPQTTEHVLVFVPFIKHLLVPLEYKYCATGHLPGYVDGFSIPPSYYYPFLPAPQIIYLDLRPFAHQAMRSLRLAFDRGDVTIASGARKTAKRYLHVAGFEVKEGDRAASDWQGMVTLEADGTAEGKSEMINRFGGGDPARAVMGPWQLVREKSMPGSVWLRLVRQQT